MHNFPRSRFRGGVVRTVIDNERAAMRSWLTDVMRRTGLRPTPLAKRAGISPSTLTRFLEGGSAILDRVTLRKIADAAGVPAPGDPAQSGFAEDLVQIDDDTPIDNPNRYTKAVGSRALELVGFLPGDEVEFDMSATPVAGDVVEVQVYTPGSLIGAETKLRVYDPPYVVPRSIDPAIKPTPFFVDGERVRIAAVAVALRRHLRKPPP